MPRIPYVDPKQRPELADLVKRITAERGGRASELYTMLLNSPTVCDGWLHLLTALRHHNTIPGTHREAVIVRIAILNDAPYEHRSHAKIALSEGLTQAQVDALADWKQSALLDADLKAVLAYCDAMTRDIRVPDAVFDAVRAIYDPKQVIELTALIGAYNMVSRFLETLKVGA